MWMLSSYYISQRSWSWGSNLINISTGPVSSFLLTVSIFRYCLFPPFNHIFSHFLHIYIFFPSLSSFPLASTFSNFPLIYPSSSCYTLSSLLLNLPKLHFLFLSPSSPFFSPSSRLSFLSFPNHFLPPSHLASSHSPAPFYFICSLFHHLNLFFSSSNSRFLIPDFFTSLIHLISSSIPKFLSFPYPSVPSFFQFLCPPRPVTSISLSCNVFSLVLFLP